MVIREFAKQGLHRLPEDLQAPLYSVRSLVSPQIRGGIVIPYDGIYRTIDIRNKKQYFSKRPIPFTQLRDRKRKKYTLDGFVEIETGDTVVDVGAFVGEFSLSAIADAEKVLSLEPDPTTAKILRQNTVRFNNVTVLEIATWFENAELSFNIASDSSDNSIMEVDSKHATKISVEADTLENIIKKENLGTVDFVKIDAEGAEPEVVRGIGDAKIGKLAIDCRPERDGASTLKPVSALLEGMGYQIQVKDGIVFARLA